MSWFEHSPLRELLDWRLQEGHGACADLGPRHSPGRQPDQGAGEKEVTDNPRYKTGRNLRHDDDVFARDDPGSVWLAQVPPFEPVHFCPRARLHGVPQQLTTALSAILTGTFQHGGISMEEMLVPLVHLRPQMMKPHSALPRAAIDEPAMRMAFDEPLMSQIRGLLGVLPALDGAMSSRFKPPWGREKPLLYRPVARSRGARCGVESHVCAVPRISVERLASRETAHSSPRPVPDPTRFGVARPGLG